LSFYYSVFIPLCVVYDGIIPINSVFCGRKKLGNYDVGVVVYDNWASMTPKRGT